MVDTGAHTEFYNEKLSLIKIGTTQVKNFYKIRSTKNKYDDGNLTRRMFITSSDLKVSIKLKWI